MKTAILVHGRPDKSEYDDPNIPLPSNDHWFPWLSKQLSMQGIHPVALEIPRPYSPRYDVWKKELERYDIDEDTILIGHSCGGGCIVRWLSENKERKVGKVVLVAPWTNPSDNPVSDTADFFHFEIDADIASRTQGLTVLHSLDDMESVRESVDLLRTSIKNIKYIEFKNKGHFVYEHTGSHEFPELLKELTV